MADIFISYTSSDRDWAFWIRDQLLALGHVPHIHEFEIKGGDDIYGWMEARHDRADHVLCVLSDAYLKAPYSTLERNAALWQAASKRPGFVLMVAVKPCRLPTLADHIRRCELFDVPEEAARARFRDFMSAPVASGPVAFPGKVFALSNIPHRVPTHFMGRDESLIAIDEALKRYEGRVAITALHGLRGVGKTTLAAAYAERHRMDYRATWWIRAQTPDTMRADIVSLGVRLQWVAADEKEVPAFGRVMERLRHEGDGLLLIYDNAIDAASLADFLPRGGAARVLITSNAHAWGEVAAPIDIRLWPKNIGADYLIARTRRTNEREAAEALSVALGGLPLAHEQAAAYCEVLGVGLAEYLRKFETTPVRLMADARYAPKSHNDGQTVERSFALAIGEAQKRHKLAEPLIFHLALLAPEPIPMFLVEELWTRSLLPLSASHVDGHDAGRHCEERSDEATQSPAGGSGSLRSARDDGEETIPDPEEAQEQLLEAIAALRAFALIDRETVPDERDATVTTDCLRLHRLVRQVAAARRPSADLARRALLEAVAAVYPGEEVFNTPATWPRARSLDALALALLGEGDPPKGVEEQTVSLLNLLAGFRHGPLAAYREARPLYERALAISRMALGPEHPSTTTSLNNLAGLLQAQGDTAAARPLYERALAIREKALGPEHPHIALSLDNLAGLLQSQGDYAAARPLCERALAITEKALGHEHPETAPRLNNLWLLLQAQGDYASARRLYERALAIDEKAFGSEHPNTNRVRHNLVRLLLATGDPGVALPLAEAALSAHEKALGPTHNWTRDSARIAAAALDALGRVEEAAALRGRFDLDAPPQGQS